MCCSHHFFFACFSAVDLFIWFVCYLPVFFLLLPQFPFILYVAFSLFFFSSLFYLLTILCLDLNAIADYFFYFSILSSWVMFWMVIWLLFCMCAFYSTSQFASDNIVIVKMCICERKKICAHFPHYLSLLLCNSNTISMDLKINDYKMKSSNWHNVQINDFIFFSLIESSWSKS